MNLSSHEILALLAATSFAAGLNVYATVGTLGLLGHYGVLPLPARLEVIGHWPIIICALALFIVEFFADKIPYFDLVWNGLQTFIRIPVAAFIAYQATAQLSPGMQVSATVLGGIIAAVAHTGKSAVRVGVTTSPEPVSNVALSSAEDIGAIGLTWFATHHPYLAGGIAVVLLLMILLLARAIIRRIRTGYQELRQRWAQA